MHDSSLEYLGCPRCGSCLNLAVLGQAGEVDEGFLECGRCCLQFPVIAGLPILWDGFERYLSGRASLGRRLLGMARHRDMKKFVKSCLPAHPDPDDRAPLEQKWSEIYQNSQRSGFYSAVRRELDYAGVSGLALEYGSSVGAAARHLSASCRRVFGMDRSFDALHVAKRRGSKNTEYVVADFASGVFARTKFDTILALNVLELAEPELLLRQVSAQTSRGGTFVLSDPYDYERGSRSAKKPLGSKEIRSVLQKLGFAVSVRTRRPAYIPWSLKINPRATLRYRVDLVISKKL